MVEYARTNYGDSRRVFLEADIGEPNFEKLQEAFDKEDTVLGFDKISRFTVFTGSKTTGKYGTGFYG